VANNNLNLSITLSVDRRQALREIVQARQDLRSLEVQSRAATLATSQAAQNLRNNPGNAAAQQAFDRARDQARALNTQLQTQRQNLHTLQQQAAATAQAIARAQAQAQANAQANAQPNINAPNQSSANDIPVAHSAQSRTRPAGSLNTDASSEAVNRLNNQIQNMGRVTAAFLAVQQLFAPFVGQVFALSDAYSNMNASLRLAVGTSGSLAQAHSDVARIANQALAPLAATSKLYERISASTRDLGIAQSDVAKITSTVTLALAVSGASTAESGSAMLQLSQAFGSGVLRGEEFNAIAEAAPRLLDVLATALGRPRGELRAMAEQGLLTSKLMALALPQGLNQLEAEAASFPLTISGAFQVLNNNMMLFIGGINNATTATGQQSGIISGFANSIIALSNNIAAASVLVLTGILAWAAAKIQAVLKTRAAEAAAARAALIETRTQALAQAQADAARATGFARHAAQEAALRAQMALTAAQQVATANAGVLAMGRVAAAGRGLLSVLTGPVGLVIGIGLAAAAWIGFRDEGTAAIEAVIAKQRELEAVKAEGGKKGVVATEGNATLIKDVQNAEAALAAKSAEIDKQKGYLFGSLNDQKEAKKRLPGALEEQRLAAAALGNAQRALEDDERTRQEAAGKIKDELAETQRAKSLAAINASGKIMLQVQNTQTDNELAALDKNAKDYGAKKRALDQRKIRDEMAYQRKLLDAKNQELAKAKPEARQGLQVESAGIAADINELNSQLTRPDSTAGKAASSKAGVGAGRQDKSAELALSAQTEQLKYAYDTRKVSIETYFTRKTELEIQQASLDKKGAEFSTERSRIEQTNTRERITAQEQLLSAVQAVEYKLKQATGTLTPDDAQAKIARDYQEQRETFAANANTEGVDLVDKLINVEAARERLSLLEAAWRETMQRLSQIQDNLKAQFDAGLISQNALSEGVAQASKQASTEAERLLPKMEAEAVQISPKAVGDVRALSTEMLRLKAVSDDVAATLNTQFKSAFADLFMDLTSGAMSAGEAFKAFGLSIVKSMQNIVAQKFAEHIFGAVLGGGSGGAGGVVSAVIGAFTGGAKAEGGYVAGPGTSTSDSIPTLLSNGEYVIKASTVQQLGVGFLDSVNSGAWQRRATGGVVGSAAGVGNIMSSSINTGGDVIVNVNVDAQSGASSVQTDGGQDAQQMAALGRMVGAKVRDVLMTEMRPGGLLGAR